MTLFRLSCWVFETCKNTHNLISHQNSRFHYFFWWHLPKKRLSKPKNDDPSRLFSLFCSSTCYPFDGHAKCMKPAKTHKLNCNTFAAPKKVVPTVCTRYNREQLGKYTGKLLVTTDPGIRVWYGMVVYQKDGKTCEGSPLSALQAYNQIISLLFPLLFSIIFHISLVFPYCSLLFLFFTYYFPLSSLFLPYYFPIYNFLILPDYCPICLLGFQNDKLRHLEWLCFDCHAKCLKPAKIHIIWFPTKILDFTAFWWHFPKKTTIETQKWWPFQIILTFLFIHLLPFRRSC